MMSGHHHFQSPAVPQWSWTLRTGLSRSALALACSAAALLAIGCLDLHRDTVAELPASDPIDAASPGLEVGYGDVSAEPGVDADAAGSPDAAPADGEGGAADVVDDVTDVGDPGCQLDCDADQPPLPPCSYYVLDAEACSCLIAVEPELTACDDWNPCTVEERCKAGGGTVACVGVPLAPAILCDDGNPCTVETCELETGCLHAPAEEASCDDGDPCTAGEACSDGVCQAPTQFTCGTCDPAGDDTCEAQHGDGDPCNGTLVCSAGFCLVDADTVFPCPSGGDSCTDLGCAVVDGEPQCVALIAADGTPCSDQSICTSNDSCLEGTCQGDPSDQEACICEEDDDCLPLDDPNLCDGRVRCLDGLCKWDATTVVDCSGLQGDACHVPKCAPAEGKCQAAELADGTPCDDGDLCSLDDACASGLCVGAASLDCGFLTQECATGVCDSVVGCVAAAKGEMESLPCDIGDACVTSSVCLAGTCEAAVGLDCDDGDPCTVDSCDEGTGCKSTGPAPPTCPTEGACAGGVGLVCVDGAYQCDLESVPGYHAVELCDDVDNDCDGAVETAGDCAETISCGLGDLAKDYGSMQACSVPEGTLWQAGMCTGGWTVCTYGQLLSRVGAAAVPSGFWLAAAAEYDVGADAWSVSDTHDAACRPFEGDCGQSRSVQAMTWEGLYQNKLPYAAEAWGCTAGAPDEDCASAQALGVMCCQPECTTVEDCSEFDPQSCTTESCLATIGECIAEQAAAPDECLSEGVCAAGVPVVCMDGELQCDPSGLAGFEPVEASCDGVDNDCDGLADAYDVDLEASVPPCALTVGVCANAVRSAAHCQGGSWQPCSANDYEAAAPDGAFDDANDAWCDGLDNDCNGLTDESFAYKGLHVGSICEGEGVCPPGVVECSADKLGIQCSTLPGGSGFGGSDEVCDGLDNDCDGLTDEAAELDPALSGCSADGVCAAVVPVCDQGGWVCPVDVLDGYEADEVSCDGLDNDCDGAVDEAMAWLDVGDPIPLGEDCGPPECPGVSACTADELGLACSTQAEGGVEICDGLDNDCDDSTDEAMEWDDPLYGPGIPLGEACTGLGICAGLDSSDPIVGQVQCSATGGVICSTMSGGVDSVSQPEVCDGLDNDCDGETDDGLTWQGIPLGQPCVGTGACGAGVVECGSDGAALCSSNPGGSESAASDESCNEVDDDCDGLVDEPADLNVLESHCSFDGVCTPQNVDATCAGGLWSCSYAGVPLYQAGDEAGRCDGADNDCDGETDEDFATLGDACDGDDADSCANGQLVCGDDAQTVACAQDEEVVEVCNDADDDCDGAVDEPDASGCVPHWEDGDGDGFGVGTESCLCGPSGVLTALQPGDCDDELGGVNPDGSELCNGLDDDCDGATDTADAADLLANDSRSCEDQQGVCAGVLKPTELCQDGHWEPCDPQHYSAVRPAFEADWEQTCDGLDNDCDGETDETLPSVQPCASQSGVCGGAMTPGEYCQQGAWLPCDTDVYDAWSGGSYEPDEEQSCDSLDNDCDGTADDGFKYFGAAIGVACDGVGACGLGVVQCVPSGVVATCSTNPDGSAPDTADETCNGADDDCDGVVDEGVPIEQSPCFLEGVCDATNVSATCVSASWSCNYAAVEAYESGAEASCDGLDNDCDGTPDDDFLLLDTDGLLKARNEACGADGCEGVVVCAPDGLGVACSSGLGGDVELCDGIDNDCDGQVDEGQAWVDPATGASLGLGSPCDGIGECGVGVVECGTGLVATCSTNPDGAAHDDGVEGCDGLDNDCDGGTDEGFTWAGNALGQPCDGAGACGLGEVVCSLVIGSGATCSTNPDGGAWDGSEELCDGVDNDCDGSTDEDVDWQAEGGCLIAGVCSPGNTVATCVGGEGWSCEYQSGKYQAGDETGRCDGADNDCDGATDEDFGDLGVACDSEEDADLCAYGAFDCASDGDGVVCAGDVAVAERCDTPGVDDDCDGATEEPGADDCQTFWRDGDSDGFGLLGDSLCRCASVPDELYDATNHDDCDDGNTDVNPDAPERCDPAGVDDDCDSETDEPAAMGCEDYRKDSDEDDWGTEVTQCQCAPLYPFTAELALDGDCNDLDPNVNPGESETCDPIDVDCDGTAIEPDAEGCVEYFEDKDGDDFGDSLVASQCLCAPDESEDLTALEGGDCCDIDDWVHPDQTSYFSFENWCSDFDWNCADGAEQRWPDEATCTCIVEAGKEACSECNLVDGWYLIADVDGGPHIPPCGGGGYQPTACYVNWWGGCSKWGYLKLEQECR